MTTAAGNTFDKTATRHPIERRLVAGFAAALAALVPERARRVLEVGCGEGHEMRNVAASHPEAMVAGIDVADAAWLAPWHPPPRRVAIADAEALPFGSQTFDLVLALEVLEHLQDPGAALDEIARVGRGVVIVSVPWEPVWRAGNMVRGRYLRTLGNTPGHLQHFTRHGLLRLLSDRFDVDAVRRPVPWTLVRARTRHGGVGRTP